MTITETGPIRSDEEAALQELIAKADADAKQLWHDPVWHKAMAQEIHTQIWWGFQHENLLQYFVDVETAVNEGDRIVIEDVYGVEVFWHALGARIEETDVYSTEWEMKGDYLGFHVKLFESVIRANFTKRSQLLIASCIQQMDAAINSRMFRTFQRAVPGPSSPYYIDGPGVDLETVENAVVDVEEESLVGNAAIIGRRRMTQQIMNAVRDSNQFLPETNEAILRTGVLGSYRGTPIIELKNFRDRNKRSYFPNNEMFVVAKDAAKAALWGGLETREGSEQLGWYWDYLGRRKCGFAVYRPQATRRIVDTSLDA